MLKSHVIFWELSVDGILNSRLTVHPEHLKSYKDGCIPYRSYNERRTYFLGRVARDFDGVLLTQRHQYSAKQGISHPDLMTKNGFLENIFFHISAVYALA